MKVGEKNSRVLSETEAVETSCLPSSEAGQGWSTHCVSLWAVTLALRKEDETSHCPCVSTATLGPACSLEAARGSDGAGEVAVSQRRNATGDALILK